MNEIIEKRGRHSKTFDLGGGKYRLETGNHPHTFKNGLWLPVDTSVESEAGTDSEVGMSYVARSRFESLDYDIRFGKNDPVWMKIKHIPTNKTVVFKPRNNNNRPDHVITGNKIYVSQAWDGIDIEIYVTDQGTKTNYVITSTAGQRIVEFNVSGDLASFKVSPPWYKHPETKLPVFVPTAFVSGVLSYDFRSVPVGSVVDPSVSAQDNDVDASISQSATTTNYSAFDWMGSGALNGANSYWHSFWKADLSAVAEGTYDVTNASFSLKEFDGSANADYDIIVGVHALKRAFTKASVTWNKYDGTNDWGTAGCNNTTSDRDANYCASYQFEGNASARTFALVGDGLSTVIAGWLASQASNFGFRINCLDEPINEGSYYQWRQWRGSRHATASDRPLLAFDYDAPASSGASSPSFGVGKQYPSANWRGWR